MKYIIFEKIPDDFNITVEAAGCYCECGDRILFLKRHSQKPQGGTWGVPGGKLEKGETPREAVIREVMEEVGVDVAGDDKEDRLGEVTPLYIRLPHIDYVYHRFFKRFSTLPEIHLGLDEHDEARWVTVEEAFRLPLIAGGKESLLDYKKQRALG